ncbi:MAG TPA: hypothetical protein VL463_10790 [Kofleriaceae bacterium]|nr:hypothetical protein [Kofleriaceae bacterium]
MTRPSLAIVAALGCAACFGPSPTTGTDTDPECQLHTPSEKTPGYPYSIDKFDHDVLPLLLKSCASAGCHASPNGNGGFSVWADAAPGNCSYAKTFNSVIAKIDLATPANSQLLAAVGGGDTAHPMKLSAGSADLLAISGFIDDAAKTNAGNGGGTTPPPGPSPFDYAVYQAQIQPAFDAANCTKSGCHGTGAGGFTIKPAPAAGSDDMQANFIAVSSRTTLADPPTSLIYRNGTTVHGGGLSTQLSADDAQKLLAWITAAKDAAGNGGGGNNPTCANVSLFNDGVFRTEILPILNGSLDLNQPDGQGHGAGCMSGACHGVDRGPGKLSLLPNADSATQLQNFACFVNLTSPSQSEIVQCPLNNPGCRRYPHPGQDVFGGATDLNYQRVLGFLYGAKLDNSPLDFAFYVRKVNPIFNDVNAVENGAQNRTCADSACHGIAVAGQPAPNGSDFPIIGNASDGGRLAFDFVSATGFVNFLNPGESSLVLYPTNEIADRANHPFATGIPHPGGTDFAIDSVQARTILTWAAGLRPDADGVQRNWLVLGDFPATRVADQTLVDEATVTPKIFDTGGGSFNRGEWDGLFSDVQEVDLNLAFPRDATGGRVAYAVSYAINTQPFAQTAQLVVSTDNPLRIYVNGILVAQNDNSGGASAIVSLPAAGTQPPPRLLIKLLQRPTDARFAFTAKLEDELGNLLTDQNGGLVFTLGPNGGI